MKNSGLFGIVALAAALAAPVAFGQSAPPVHMAKTPAETEVMKNMSRNVDAHIAALRKQLEITPAEESQWGAFAQVMRDNAAQMDAAFTARGASFQSMTAVQDMQSYAKIAQIQSDNMQKLSGAFETLYGDFPAPQQRLADKVFRPQMVRK